MAFMKTTELSSKAVSSTLSKIWALFKPYKKYSYSNSIVKFFQHLYKPFSNFTVCDFVICRSRCGLEILHMQVLFFQILLNFYVLITFLFVSPRKIEKAFDRNTDPSFWINLFDQIMIQWFDWTI